MSAETKRHLRAQMVLATFILHIAIVCGAAGGAYAQDSSAPTKAPVPSHETQAHHRTRMRDHAFPRQYAEKGNEARKALAELLLDTAITFSGSSDELFVLLDEAQTIAASVGEVAIALRAVDLLEGRFVLDGWQLRMRAVAAALDGAPRMARATVMSVGLDMFADCLSSLDSKRGLELKELLRRPIRQARDAGLAARYDALSNQADECREAELAMEVLRKDEADKDANRIAGRYLLLRLGDAQTALPMLAASSDSLLAGIASLDLSNPEECESRIKLAQWWREIAGSVPDYAEEFAWMRVGHWCKQALACATGLDENIMTNLCEEAAAWRQSSRSRPKSTPTRPTSERHPGAIVPPPSSVSSWAIVLEEKPDPKVVTNRPLRQAIERSGLPWRVRHERSGVEMLLLADVPPDKRLLYVGRYEVQASEYQHIMDGRPLATELGLPIFGVGWSKVTAYLNRLGDVRLLAPEEWDFACRAGTAGDRYGKLEDIAWHRMNSNETGQRVGSKDANALGLHDMLGNAYEWCSDRMGRGGSWKHSLVDETCRAGHAIPFSSDENPGAAVGFRICRDPHTRLGAEEDAQGPGAATALLTSAEVTLTILAGNKASVAIVAVNRSGEKTTLREVPISGKENVPDGSGEPTTAHIEHWRQQVAAALATRGVQTKRPSQRVMVHRPYNRTSWHFDLLP